MIQSDEVDDIIAAAHAAADAARGAILPYFRLSSLDVDDKHAPGAQSEGTFDPVTAADRAAEQAMRAVLARLRPADAILGEEFGEAGGTSGLTWVLDPIDGTRGFLAGTPTWGVLIAVCGPEGPIYGVIDQPYIGERFEGGLGRARLTGPAGQRSLAARGARPLAEATVMTTFPAVGTPAEGAAFARIADAARTVRYGYDCYAYALLALGLIDLVIEAGLKPYDICAPIAVIEAAGGIVTDWRGGPAHHGGRIVAAANAAQHRAALEILSQVA
ncbi:myo-inositol-1(or 4)-monophosphatase [Roseovarius nanhaiticus]|uniref:Myo-inositol-1(Or 4)-monophosphatase n=1 Tax=Roseovarius nanhaiticus TaxID=573024 RepID=A0A1N7HFR9_9RHOB|nr:inositol monophosphatase family protein [Roseovarius nanhaiticus]SEK97328.1 myo-inositol-1(or 4)-monophosphatase [Roseovarius nanhaiticus]SIS23727.1 myo-inositol-1(or 4)-monophosphatase [Roseovarius nanhaiticus]